MGERRHFQVDDTDLDVIRSIATEWLEEHETEAGHSAYDDVAELQARVQLAIVRRRKRARNG